MYFSPVLLTLGKCEICLLNTWDWTHLWFLDKFWNSFYLYFITRLVIHAWEMTKPSLSLQQCLASAVRVCPEQISSFWEGILFSYVALNIFEKIPPPLLHFPGCTGTTGLKLYLKVSRASEENLSSEVMCKDKLELPEQLGTLLALLIINSQVKRASLDVLWKKNS